MRLCFVLIVVLLFGCEYFKPKDLKTENPIARAEENYLYISDLDGLFPANVSAQDSINLANKYIEDWIKKQLMIARSNEEIDVTKAEIDRKVLDYRYALIVHSFVKDYIDKNLEYEVADEEIVNYYTEKANNFLLRQPIVKCLFVQLPKTAPNIRSFRRNLKSFPNKNVEEVTSYVSQFATRSFVEDSVWVIFDDVILGTPLEGVSNKTQFIEKNKSSETSDDEHIFFLKIFEFKPSNEISPLEFIREDVKNVILNKRKITLKKELEKKIYEQAEAEQLFEVYSN